MMDLNNSVLPFIEKDLVLITTYVCALYFYIKYNNLKVSKLIWLCMCLFVLLLSSSCVLFGGYDSLVIKIIFISIECVSLIAINKKSQLLSIPIAIISVSFSYCLEYISVIIITLVLYIFGFTSANIVTTIITCLIQFFLCILFTRINRLKKAFSYLKKEEHFGAGLLISGYILFFSLSISIEGWVQNTLISVVLFCIPLVFIGLILWIRSIVKRYYKNKLQDRMDEYTQKEMEDKDKRIERLEAEVTALAKQVHRDNHLMTSVDRSVQELAACDSAEQREQIIGEIHTLYLERNDSIVKEQQKNKILPSTGFALIDSSLSELYVKAAARGISFDLTVSDEPYYLVNNVISQTDLQTLLCDHIKDAIIAVESAGITDGRILVTIEKKDSIFEITIRDNGVDFEADTLARIGKEQVTTHADDGGSGIGFMTTFETLHKTKGSLIITEYEQKTPFSKSVAFVFDGLNRFVISTYRKEELEKGIDRDDLLIL